LQECQPLGLDGSNHGFFFCTALGTTGAYVENTIEAMQAVIAKDNGPQGPVPDCHFVEVDIQARASLECAASLTTQHSTAVAAAAASAAAAAANEGEQQPLQQSTAA
jgi:hypothetical protein